MSMQLFNHAVITGCIEMRCSLLASSDNAFSAGAIRAAGTMRRNSIHLPPLQQPVVIRIS